MAIAGGVTATRLRTYFQKSPAISSPRASTFVAQKTLRDRKCSAQNASAGRPPNTTRESFPLVFAQSKNGFPLASQELRGEIGSQACEAPRQNAEPADGPELSRVQMKGAEIHLYSPARWRVLVQKPELSSARPTC